MNILLIMSSCHIKHNISINSKRLPEGLFTMGLQNMTPGEMTGPEPLEFELFFPATVYCIRIAGTELAIEK